MEIPAVEARNLTKKYGSLPAVNGLDLSIRRGELFGLVGADGAGKTSTLQMLCTLNRPSAGEARILGLDILKQTAQIKPRIGYMSERFTLYPTLTVAENLDFFARLRLVPPALAARRKEELLSFSRLAPFSHRLAEQLSGGMQKKLALCCSLIHEPEVIFLDEPTNGVDPLSRRDFWMIIFRYISQGITFLVSTSYLDEAERFTRVAFMHLGQIIASDTPARLKSRLTGQVLQLLTPETHRARLALQDLPGVGSAQVFGDSLHLLVEDPAKCLPAIRHSLDENHLDFQDLRPIPPGLEDIFVMLLNEKSGATAALPPTPLAILSDQNQSHTTEEVIQVTNLTRQFGRFVAVDHLNFSVRRGEIFGFLGPNGSGKTTTMRMLCGLLQPTSGTGSVLGIDMLGPSANQMRSHIGYMSQKFSLFNDMTVAENINFYAGLYGLSGVRLRERKIWVLAMAGLTGKEKLLPRELSGGWKQRLALGCAIIHSPEVIFLDEPTAGVDPLSRRFFWELIQDLANLGTTILITTHYMDEAEHCHRLGLMHQGNLIAIGSPSQLKTGQVFGDLLEVRSSDFSRSVELLSSQPTFHRVSLFGDAVHLVAENVSPDFREIIVLLEKQGVSVHGISRVPFSLEDVFVALIEKSNHVPQSSR